MSGWSFFVFTQAFIQPSPEKSTSGVCRKETVFSRDEDLLPCSLCTGPTMSSTVRNLGRDHGIHRDICGWSVKHRQPRDGAMARKLTYPPRGA